MRFLSTFLCHASPDKPVVRMVADALSRRGILPWLDEDRLEVGTDMLKHLPEAIREQGTFVLFISPRMSDRPWVEREIVAALAEEDQGRVRIFPVFMGDPIALLKEHPLLAERWIVKDGGGVHLLGGWLPEARHDLRAAHVEEVADKLARAAYTLGGLKEAEELAICLDQRGGGPRFGVPENIPPGFPEADFPCLVFRPDRQERSHKQTLIPAEWSSIRDTMERSLSIALGDRQGRKVHILGRSQYAYPLTLGRIFQRSTQTTLICHPAHKGVAFSNEEWGHILPLKAEASGEEETEHLKSPEPGEHLQTVALVVGQKRSIPFVADYLKATPGGTQRGVFLPSYELGNSAEVRTLTERVVFTLTRLSANHGTRQVLLFTTLPLHSIALLRAYLDQLGVGITLMEWMAGTAPENVEDRNLYAPFQA